jgi:4-amino-4-deoxy-L-arabinose transferase-like glycosyltransferase
MIKRLEKYPVASLTVIVLIMLLIHLSVPNVTIMEARNFITAREMIQDNNWLLTTMNGEARYEKPPLPTWLTAISGILLGVNNLFALRLPAVLMVLFLTIFIYYFSLKLKLSNNHSFRNSLILVTSFYVVGILNEAPWDIFAHAFMLAAIYFLFRLFSENDALWKKAIFAGFLAGFSFLSKGPVSLFAVFLPFIISYGIVFKFRNFKNKIIPIFTFIVLFMVVGLWWYVYVRIADPEAFLKIASRETGNWSSYNVKPFYYYWSFFIQSGLWTIPAFISLLYPYLIKKVKNKKAYQFTFWWTIIAVILLSAIPEKKARYLMPVLIPLALNTGFYIQYLVKYFDRLSTKKETFPVYFNFGLIALIGVLFPIALVIILKENLQLFLINYVFTAIALVICSFFILKSLRQKNFKNVFYSTILFMVSIFVFAIPISEVFNSNKNYISINSLHQFETKNNINSYSIHEIAPELLWEYNGKLKNIFENELLNLPNSEKFGLLIMNEDIPIIEKQLSKDYQLEFIETYNLNYGSKQKERLIRKFYLVSKK